MGSNFKKAVTFTYIIFISQFLGLIYIYFNAIKLTTRYEDIGIDITAFIPIAFWVVMFFLFNYVIKAKKYLILFYISFSIYTSILLLFMFRMHDLLYHLGAFF
jgi:hypothetical protein